MKTREALQLASRFVLPPNSLGFCGQGSAPEKFKQCFIHGNCAGVQSELEKFIVLYPYLKTISKIVNKDAFDHEVVEAYWLGNDLLKQFEPENYKALLENFSQQGVPSWLVEELRKNPPEKFIPHHLFQVLFIGVGKASQSVPFNLESINNCMIRWGDVLKITSDTMQADLNSLTQDQNKYKLIQTTEEVPYQADFLPSLAEGDVIAVHWQQPVKILKKREIKNLAYWTEEVLSSIPLRVDQ